MPMNELAPVLVAVTGLVTALGAWFKVRHGDADKRLETEFKTKELSLQADRQDNEQIMSLVGLQQAMLEKHQERLDEMQAALERKAELEAESRSEIRLMRYQIRECEDDRVVLRARIRLLEENVMGRAFPKESRLHREPQKEGGEPAGD